MLLFSINNKSKAQEIFINVGFKLGFQFEKSNNVVFGWETSIVARDFEKKITNSRLPFLGIVFDYEFGKNFSKFHPGIELGYEMYGLDIGPTFYKSQDTKYIGYTFTAFAGGLVIPYYSFSYFPSENLASHQLGSYLKIPVNAWDKIKLD